MDKLVVVYVSFFHSVLEKKFSLKRELPERLKKCIFLEVSSLKSCVLLV